jgi:hypothetical protein
MRDAAKAWGWYVSGALTVLLALWLYARRLYPPTPAPDELEQE